MDVLVTREARLEIEALGIVRPSAPAWGFLIGHERGRRVFIEKVLAAAGAEPGTAARKFREVERLWPGHVVGLYAVRPDAELKRAVLGPFFYGKLFVELRFPHGRPVVRPFVIEYKGRFHLLPLPTAAPAKGKSP